MIDRVIDFFTLNCTKICVYFHWFGTLRVYIAWKLSGRSKEGILTKPFYLIPIDNNYFCPGKKAQVCKFPPSFYLLLAFCVWNIQSHWLCCPRRSREPWNQNQTRSLPCKAGPARIPGEIISPLKVFNCPESLHFCDIFFIFQLKKAWQ